MVLHAAAQGEQLHVLKWATANNCQSAVDYWLVSRVSLVDVSDPKCLLCISDRWRCPCMMKVLNEQSKDTLVYVVGRRLMLRNFCSTFHFHDLSMQKQHHFMFEI